MDTVLSAFKSTVFVYCTCTYTALPKIIRCINVATGNQVGIKT